MQIEKKRLSYEQFIELQTELKKNGLNAKVAYLAKKLFEDFPYKENSITLLTQTNGEKEISSNELNTLKKALKDKVTETISWHPFWKILSAVYNFFSGGVSSPHLLLRALPSDQLKELVIQLRKDEKNLEKLKIISEDLSRNFSPLELSVYTDLYPAKQQSLRHHYAEVIESILAGNTPLHIAVTQNCLPITEALINQGVDINAKETHGWTPLHGACGKGYIEIAKLLLSKNVNIEPKDLNEQTPLHLACGYGHTEVVQLLLDHKANIEAKGGPNENTPLHIACYQGHEETSKELLSRDANIEAKNAKGNTPLHLACYQGNKETVELLLQHEANVTATNSDEKTPLDCAQALHNPSKKDAIIKLLQKKLDSLIAKKIN